MTSVELSRIMRANNPNSGFKRNKSIRKPYNGVSSLYDGEGRGCRMGIQDDLKKVGAVTDLAESKI